MKDLIKTLETERDRINHAIRALQGVAAPAVRLVQRTYAKQKRIRTNINFKIVQNVIDKYPDWTASKIRDMVLSDSTNGIADTPRNRMAVVRYYSRSKAKLNGVVAVNA